MRLLTKTLLTLLFLLPLAGHSQPSDDGWQVSRRASNAADIGTWRKSLPGKALDAFKGQVTVPYSMLTVLAVMADIPNYPHWVFQCNSAKLIPRLGLDIAYIYVNGIWPVSDRDAVLRSTLTQDPTTLAVTIHSVAAPQLLPPTKDVVRMPALDNTFTLTPLSATQTRLTFITYADPGGLIPAWLANFVAVRAPYVTLRDMEKRMALPQYHISRVDQLPKLLPGSDKIRLPH